MLSNVESSNSSVTRGIAMKHQTSANATDTIYHVWASELPANNSYWTPYIKGGIDVVMDNTRPMMVHFTQEQMLNNGINSEDFAAITGRPYESGGTFIFKNKIIAKDVTCQNGYVNQTDGVIVPPGNMAQMIRESKDTKWFNRMLDRFCAPYYDAQTTLNYNDNALLNGKPMIDSISSGAISASALREQLLFREIQSRWHWHRICFSTSTRDGTSITAHTARCSPIWVRCSFLMMKQ